MLTQVDNMETRYNIYRDAIARAVEFADSDASQELTLDEAKVRLEALNTAWTRFNKRHITMCKQERNNEEVLKALTDTMQQSESGYFRVSGMLKSKIREHQPAEAERQDAADANVRPIALQVKMPFQQHDLKNTWGLFDGTLTKWQGFHDRFVAAIHDREEIAPAYKFSYLKNSLTGRAQRTLGEAIDRRQLQRSLAAIVTVI